MNPDQYALLAPVDPLGTLPMFDSTGTELEADALPDSCGDAGSAMVGALLIALIPLACVLAFLLAALAGAMRGTP